MNKKGFTLIELLGVITLIVLISLIVIPNLLSSVNKKKSEISSANMQLLSAAADVYIGDHSGMYVNSFEANGSVYCIPLQNLINAGILETPFKDVSGNEVDYSDVVKATYSAQYNGFQYEFVKKNACTEVVQYVSRPKLADNMIPVIYEDGVWKKADASSKWYNYSEKEWANAVLVREWKGTESGSKSRYEYLEASYGTVINEFDILGYFVWIPRFRFQLFDSNSRIPINVVFESVSTAKSGGTITGQWLTHPAFTYNGNELTGIWVGKYKSSNSDNNVVIKPNLAAWTSIDYNGSNVASINMLNDNNIYGLSNINSHMMRDSEWGAVAYLSNSLYGINDSITSSSTTTGNNTGIYDIVGSKEYVILDTDNVNSPGHSLIDTDSWTSNTNSFIDGDYSYLTRGGSSIFNYDKSKIIDNDASFRVCLINIETAIDYKHKYIVNFNPNGGIVSELTKEVTYGDSYGSLPTPTRTGYTFLGWNGKNLFNKDNVQIGVELNSSTGGLSTNADWYSSYFISINSDTNYVISSSSKTQGKANCFYSSNEQFISNVNAITGTITSPNNSSYLKINGLVSELDNNIQLEEGQIPTSYEPYYVTKDTLVTQDKDHTLNAIWRAN